MLFEVAGGRWSDPRTHRRPVLLLRRDNWDDFGFKTTFEALLYLGNETPIELGMVKIMRRGQDRGPTQMPDGVFEGLGDEYCSLGQDVEYYEKLGEVTERVRNQVLSGIKDAAYDQAVRRAFIGTEAWQMSLVRSGQATHALEIVKESSKGERRAPGIATFEYVHADPSPLKISFEFDDTGVLPGRANVIIGYNGVGKTRLLADIARVASEGQGNAGSVSRLVGVDSTFRSVVAVSYSAFDDFELPQEKARGQDLDAFTQGRTDVFGYVYCGLRKTDNARVREGDTRDELKSLNEIDSELLDALERGRHRRMGDDHPLQCALRMLDGEPSFARIGVQPASWLDIGVKPADEIRKLSTGHKIVVNIVAQLAAHLKPRSIVLLDEPETHLHPPLLAALLKVIHGLLGAYDSFVIIATHSPVVLQEVPSSSVHVLTRFGDQTSVERPLSETFGENVGAITRQIFSLDSSAMDYQGVLAELAARYSVAELERYFPNGLSDTARALVLRHQQERR